MKHLAFVLLGACGTVSSFTPTNPSPRPLQPRPVEQVELFTAGTPTREYVEVGIVTARPKSGLSSADDVAVLTQLRIEGAKHGCDGVVVNDETSNFWVGSSQVSEQKSFRAACIMYR